MKIYKTTTVSGGIDVENHFIAGQSGLLINIADEIVVVTGTLASCDLDECERIGLKVVRGLYFGGSIVCFPGDLSLCEMHWGNSDFARTAVERVATWLENRGINITRDGNDILADGRKVASWARATTLQGWVQNVAHFSINSDLGLIQSICTKTMEKIPGQLSDYGITAEDILSVLELEGL